MEKTSTAVAGIDTAKDKLDVAIHGQAKHWRVENTLRGWRRLRAARRRTVGWVSEA
jgi:transposase